MRGAKGEAAAPGSNLSANLARFLKLEIGMEKFMIRYVKILGNRRALV